VKYINHLNAIIAIIGVVVIAYTLSRTLWQGEPQAPRSVDIPQAQPALSSPSVPRPPAARSALPFRSPRADSPARATVADADTAGAEAEAEAAPPSGPASGIPIGMGAASPARSVIAGRSGAQPARGAQPGATQRAIPRSTLPGQNRSSVFVPPPTASGVEKRQPGDNNPRVPPTRGSQPEN
jgi:hypothetical protein